MESLQEVLQKLALKPIFIRQRITEILKLVINSTKAQILFKNKPKPKQTIT